MFSKFAEDIVYIGVSNTTLLFSAKPPPLINLQTLEAPFLSNSLLYIGFSWTPLKKRIFQWTPMLKFFILNPIPSFNSN